MITVFKKEGGGGTSEVWSWSQIQFFLWLPLLCNMNQKTIFTLRKSQLLLQLWARKEYLKRNYLPSFQPLQPFACFQMNARRPLVLTGWWPRGPMIAPRIRSQPPKNPNWCLQIAACHNVREGRLLLECQKYAIYWWREPGNSIRDPGIIRTGVGLLVLLGRG